MTFEAFQHVLTTFGLCAALTVFFVWQSFEREKRLMHRLEMLEEFCRTTLITLCDKTTTALIEDTAAGRANVDVVARLQRSLDEHHAFAVQFAAKSTSV